MAPHALRPSARRLLCAGGLWLAAAGAASAQPATLPPPQPVPVAPTVVIHPNAVMRYSLPDALAVAHEHHPQLAALRASMNAALLKGRGLGEVRHRSSRSKSGG